jgi:hypothetical protein
MLPSVLEKIVTSDLEIFPSCSTLLIGTQGDTDIIAPEEGKSLQYGYVSDRRRTPHVQSVQSEEHVLHLILSDKTRVDLYLRSENLPAVQYEAVLSSQYSTKRREYLSSTLQAKPHQPRRGR